MLSAKKESAMPTETQTPLYLLTTSKRQMPSDVNTIN